MGHLCALFNGFKGVVMTYLVILLAVLLTRVDGEAWRLSVAPGLVTPPFPIDEVLLTGESGFIIPINETTVILVRDNVPELWRVGTTPAAPALLELRKP